MPRAERLAVLGLLGAMAVSAATILILGRDLTFSSDEFDWLIFGDDFAPETLLAPHNSHLIAIPRAIYELLPRLVGTDYLAFRLVGSSASSPAAAPSSCSLEAAWAARWLWGRRSCSCSSEPPPRPS